MSFVHDYLAITSKGMIDPGTGHADVIEVIELTQERTTLLDHGFKRVPLNSAVVTPF